MTIRTLVTLGIYASLVPLVSAGGSGRPPAAAAFGDLEAPVIHDAQDRPAAATAQDTTLPVKSAAFERHDASAGLAGVVRGIQAKDPGPAWLAWTVPTVRREHRDSHREEWTRDAEGPCVLSDDGVIECGARSHSTTSDGTTAIVVFARYGERRIDRVTFTDARRVVDARTARVHWMDRVRPSDSVSLLADVVGARSAGRNGDHDAALAALALTDDRSADQALELFTARDVDRPLRQQAAFWLGAARGAAGAKVIDRLAASDPDEQFRQHLTFVLTLTGATGIDRLIDLARHDPAGRVRGQALFWLGQKAGERATAALAQAVNDDPDADVRRQAVFAISQLPDGEGVPKLIALAETHRDAAVRKQAMFWLGQSGDPRAIALFERVLKP